MSSDLREGLVLAGEDTPSPIAFPVETGELRLSTVRSPARETPNEDGVGAWRIGGGALVLAVADGMGGTPAGAAASRVALQALGDALPPHSDDDSLRGPVLDGFEAANEAVRALAVGAGTTLVVAEIVGGVLRTYHVGDSAALVVGQRGRVKLETISHSPVGYGVAAGLIEPDDAVVHEDRHYVSNHLGTAEMTIEVGSPLRLAARDTLLLASDGLFDNLLPQEIVDAIRKGPLERVAVALRERIFTRMTTPQSEAPSKADDATFALYRPRASTSR